VKTHAPPLAERTPHTVQRNPASRNSRPGGPVSQLRAMIERSPAMLAQRRACAAIQRAELEATPTTTGLPDQLKSSIESLSGIAMDDVKVHYNSGKPAKLNAHAYAQGRDIFVAPGQESHLPHEAWHMVQQAQGRVKPTMQMKGRAVNNDAALEHEADTMGARAVQAKGAPGGPVGQRRADTVQHLEHGGTPLQRMELSSSKLNIAGENHGESGKRRSSESAYAREKGVTPYSREGELTFMPKVRFYQTSKETHGDPFLLRTEHLLAILQDKHSGVFLERFAAGKTPDALAGAGTLCEAWSIYADILADAVSEPATALIGALNSPGEGGQAIEGESTHEGLTALASSIKVLRSLDSPSAIASAAQDIRKEIARIRLLYSSKVAGKRGNRSEEQISRLRSDAMRKAARECGQSGLWKVGDQHISDMKAAGPGETAEYRIMSKDEFEADYEPWQSSKKASTMAPPEKEPDPGATPAKTIAPDTQEKTA
jgi:hypothetical protein